MSSPNRNQTPTSQPSSQRSDISIGHDSFSVTSSMLIDGSISSRAGKGPGVAGHSESHPEELFDQQGPDIISFQRVTIGSLPDMVLLDIFDFYQINAILYHSWIRLVHVCRRWRSVVFASPQRLGLQLTCRATTPVREMLDVWPPMQIIVLVENYGPTHLDGDNIITALEHPDRVCDIYLSYLPSSLLERLATVMQEPFPVLRHLNLCCETPAPVLRDTFLGGFAPRLKSLSLWRIPFPALPKLLLSARDLVNLDLRGVPDTGYISPDAMVACLSALTKLESLTLEFQSPSCPDRGSQRPLLLTRVDLPALTTLLLTGVSEYLEDFLVRINTPVITTATITFFNRAIFDTPQLFKFVSRANALRSVKRAELFLDGCFAGLSIHRPDSPQGRYYNDGFPIVRVQCDAFDGKISFLVQICSQLSRILSGVERLDIACHIDLLRQDDVDHRRWLAIFRPFIAVQSLQILGLDGLIARALQELTGARVMEVLPALRSLFVTDPDPSGSVGQAIEPFINARHLSNQPVTIHQWKLVPCAGNR